MDDHAFARLTYLRTSRANHELPKLLTYNDGHDKQSEVNCTLNYPNTASTASDESGVDMEAVRNVLNNLQSISKDGAQGWREAAEAINNDSYKVLFIEYAHQRDQFVTELRRMLESFGESNLNEGSPLAAIHRGWINLRAAISNGDEKAILEECHRGESAALKAYEDALNDSLPAMVRVLVQDQYRQVKAAHDHVRSLSHHETRS